MKVAIVGSRTLPNGANYSNTQEFFNTLIKLCEIQYPNMFKISEITEVVCGCALGPDTAGEQWGITNNIPVKYFPPDRKLPIPERFYKRNEDMAIYCDFGLIFWDGQSSGTKHMIDMLNKHQKHYFILGWRYSPIF